MANEHPRLPRRTKLQIAAAVLIAAIAIVWSSRFPSHSWPQFCLLLTAILLSSGLKVALPRGDGSMSLNFPFILLAIVQVSPLQALVLAALSVAAQCRIRVKKVFTLVQIGFNVANAVIATAGADLTYIALSHYHFALAPKLALAAVAYFFCSTGAVAAVLSSSKGEPALPLWMSEFRWYLPFYIVGAVLAAAANLIGVKYGWATSMLLIPMVYTVYRSYTAQTARIKEREQHLQETEALQLRTIEGLAMAIEAKDQNTHDHLFRVRSYVEDVGSALHVDTLEMHALQIAALLHDIGKLAVPEYIINKPGKLTPEEFEKMKIHPVVGADILERVRFPYPVVPIVRSHHEWWDGRGYPDGLKGEEIPIGARILTVVDCFDALVSDRPYRKALPPQKALATIKSLSGTQFDPSVVKVLEQRYEHLAELMEPAETRTFVPLNTGVEVWRGLAPGAGFEEEHNRAEAIPSKPSEDSRTRDERSPDAPTGIHSLSLIAAASQEAQTLFEMSQSLGNSLSLNETISVMACRLRRLIRFDSCALYVKSGDHLVAQYVDGENAKSFSAEPVGPGEGISGWVAQSGKPILNGNPALEPSYHRKFGLSGELRSALSMPLYDLEKQVFAVLTLYAMEIDAFSRDHLRILQATESKLSLSLQNALHFRRAESDAETDYLTQLPNARRLFLQLEMELERCRESGRSLAVVVCDLNSFKEVNDRRGHLAGNKLLTMISEGFRHNCGDGDTVARMGGDEFVFLLQNTTQENSAMRLQAIAATVISATRRAGVEINVTASLGASFYPVDARTAEDLLALADRRMYLDKQAHYEAELATPANVTPIREAIAV
jgi:diguanylate cyclase (GGDEF)-like protein/putative nucleotidyltransferase with HDIG domain